MFFQKSKKYIQLKRAFLMVLLCSVGILTSCGGSRQSSEIKKGTTQIRKERTKQDESENATTETAVATEETTQSSGEGFYYNQLSDTEKTIYQEMLKGCQNYESDIALSSCSEQELNRAEAAMVAEHPEFYWIDSFHYQYIGDVIVSVQFSVPEDAKSVSEQLNSIGDEIVSKLSGSDYDKVKALYEYIIDETDYNFNAENNQDIRSVLLNKESVCAGYARTFEYLCQKAGISCTYVSGSAKGGDHAWNLIHINGNYYWVDVTWGDPIYLDDPERKRINYDYLCVSDDNFTNHTLDQGLGYNAGFTFEYPSCTDDSLNYYRLQGWYFENYDSAEIRQYLVDSIQSGKTTDIEMKFASQQAYREAVNDLFTRKNVYEMVKDALGYDSVRWSYEQSEESCYISVSFQQAK